MKTAEEIILDIQELSLEERQKIREFMDEKDEYVETCYTRKVMEEISHDVEEAEKGINVSGTFDNAQEVISHLKRLRKSS